MAYRYATINTASTVLASYGDLDWKDMRARMSNMGNALQNITAPSASLVNPWVALQAGTSLLVEQPSGASLPLQTQDALTADQLVTLALNTHQQVGGRAKPSWL